ncbi:acylphosphatase [Curvivirga aplysinae]|uniref:acylphosphatase n=1 Tax=Curvivirga aplysinae TaxID=2529852 RepID=UPI0012BB4F44|nr:acylphosphatase [Curvivirga aplysinae]MTI11278.1 acylphosphatase [Curvivirga aplysinae]
MTKSVLTRIEGKVQGVWYRNWTVENAKELGLNGWVRNRVDSSVEALFSGDDSIVDEMLKRCEDGPQLARVTAVLVEACEAPKDAGFHKLPTM